jgi:hypothetical protein
MGAVPPIMLKTKNNPGGLPIEVFDGFRKAYLDDRSQFFLNVASGPFFNFNRPGAKVSQGLIQSWWMQGLMSGPTRPPGGDSSAGGFGLMRGELDHIRAENAPQ